MRPDELVGEAIPAGFLAKPLLHGEWRRRGARRAIPAALVIADPAGIPTVAFQGLCRAAFGRAPPTDAIMDGEGRATRYFGLWLDR